MRIASLLLLTACSSTSVSDAGASSVRDRLGAPTRLLVTPDDSLGSVEGRRRTADGWSAGTAELRIATGELVASTAIDGQLVVSEFGVGFAPIDLPLGNGVALTQVRLDLVAPQVATATWRGDDAMTGATTFELGLAWSLSVDGASAALGSQRLAPVLVELGLEGDGATVDGTITITAPGTLWSWAGLVELAELRLSLAAVTP